MTRIILRFLGWIMALGDGVKIVAPNAVVERMKKEIQLLNEMYCSDEGEKSR